MKLLTLNTHAWLEDDQLMKIEQLAQKIIDENYDIIALQEVNQLSQNKIIDKPLNYINYQNQTMPIKQNNYALVLVELLANKFNQTYFWTWAYNHQSYDRFDEGVALLSKYPLQQVHSLPFSKTTDPLDYHTRVAIGATITYRKQQFTFYSLHTSWWKNPEG